MHVLHRLHVAEQVISPVRDKMWAEMKRYEDDFRSQP